MTDNTLAPCGHCGSKDIRVTPNQAAIDAGWPMLVICGDCDATSPNPELWNQRAWVTEARRMVKEAESLEIANDTAGYIAASKKYAMTVHYLARLLQSQGFSVGDSASNDGYEVEE